MAQEVFRRVEKKYLMQEKQYQQLMEGLNEKMSPDVYGKHTIRNIYFDTEDFALIQTSLQKPLYKEKIRLRSYGRPEEDDIVFIELKKKYKGVVYKRRVPLSLCQARAYLYHGIYPEQDTQILKEIDYSVRRYDVRPAVFLSYDRIALFDGSNPELRVTFDCDIRARRTGLDLTKDGYDKLLLEPDEILMEVKIPGSMPMWMSRLFSEIGIYPVSFSKYGTFFKQEIVPELYKGMGGKNCA